MDNKIIVTSDKGKAKGKTIQINPEFLKLNGNLRKNKTLKHERKQKPIQSQNVDTNPSQIKKKLIEKIQAFKNKGVMQEKRVQEKRVQENRVQEHQSKEDKERDKFNNEFNKSLDFLQSLSNKRKENKEQHKVQNNVQNKVQSRLQNKVDNKAHNNTLKHGKIERTVHNEVINDILETELPPELSNTFRYPPQKNINFFENIVPTALEPTALEPTALEPTALEEPILTEPILIKPILIEPILTEPIALPIQKLNTSEPAYSNLKNGSRPTFREWKNQTVKNNHLPKHKKIQIMDEEAISPEPMRSEPMRSEPMRSEPITQEPMRSEAITHKTALQELKEFIQKPIIEEKKTTLPEPDIEPEQPIHKTQSIKKITTRTLKYKLGKRGKKVGVLIKNAKTRKIIQREYALLKQKQISDIKNYLRSKNLLKIGSDAPNDVLRQMYEQAILSGEVENKAGETLIHNFMNS